MRLANINTAEGLRLHVRGRSGYIDAAAATGDPQLGSIAYVLGAGEPAFDRLRALQDGEGREVAPEEIGPAVPAPPRILCLGVNYSDHAIEGGREVPTWPESFVRGTASVIGPYADLVRPALTERFDYEGELGIVIGRGGRYIRKEDALAAVAGFVVCNDGSARDWQRANTQWTPGKNFDGTMPLGPELVTVDEVDVSDLGLTTLVNGEVRQSGRTSQMLVDVPSTVEYFSSFTTLVPGDVIATGTPGGVGMARKPPLWLQPGDVVEVTIEGIGTIRNRVVAEQRPAGSWRWVPTVAESRAF
ncbi:MAG TPA: fumarylacetoacetate hydrolase family protein [Candidatus Dormibacteraeota bacterium]|nr:fumarylacetoacetate hydrolase family protein [Candidatus Dormibacteraeota bacterium]